MNPSNDEQTLGLEQALAILRRRAPIIALCFVLVAGSSFFFSKQQTKKYTAKTALVFNNSQVSQQVAGLAATAGIEPKAQQDTNVKLLEIGPTAGQAAKRIGSGLTGKAVKESIAVSPEGESNVVNVEATSPSPKLAARIANVYAHQFVKDQLEGNRRYFASALALVEKQLGALSKQQRVGPQGLALQDRAQSLAILSELQSGNVEVAEAAAVPTSPSSPKTARNTVLGAVLGLLLGVGIAFLLERLDQRIKEPEELERIYGLPLLGTIPESAAYRRHSPQQIGDPSTPLPPEELEVFRMLRARLRYFNVDKSLRVVLVTSQTSGDGKTTVVQDLAEAAAGMGSRVLLVEADLRRPSIAMRLGLRAVPGLGDVLISASGMEETIQNADMRESGPSTAGSLSGAGKPSETRRLSGTGRPSGVGGSGSGGCLDVLVAGIGAPNPSELLESNAIEQLLRTASESYDLVLVDTPPLSMVPDAIPLLRKVDGVVIVSRLRKNTRDGAARLRDELRSLGAPVLGVVANGLKVRGASGYGYGYGYYQSSTKEAELLSANGSKPQPRAPEGEPALD